MVKHSVAQIGFHPDRRPVKADAPQKTPYHHDQYDHDQPQADFVQQHLHRKGNKTPVNFHRAAVHAVYHNAVQFRQDQLKIIHENKRRNAHKQ